MPPLDKITGQLGVQRATHLLRRVTFGPTPQDINDFSTLTIDQAMDKLFATPAVEVPSPPIDPQTGSTWLNPAATSANSSQDNLNQYFMAWHLEQMRNSGTNIRERIVWFLHSHLPAKISKVKRSESLYYQNKLYRHYAFGSFKTMFRKVCVDNAMLRFLDNDTNDASDPNENFAREMMELYSIGRGKQIGDGDYTTYSETDVKAAARVLTGYETDETYKTLDPDTGIPAGNMRSISVNGKLVANHHTADPKQFSSSFQKKIIQPADVVGGYATLEAAEGELDDMITMIFDQDATAKFLTRKIYRFFVYYIIDDNSETNIITPLAQKFKDSGYMLPTLIRSLLSSQHFFDADNTDTSDDTKGAIIKSPVDLVLGICRMFNITFPTDSSTLYKTVYQNGLIAELIKEGINLYEPYDVAGYPAYFQVPNFNRNWITPYYMAYRYQFADIILNGKKQNGDDLGIQLDILSWVKDKTNISDPSDAQALVSRLAELLYPFPLSSDRLNYFLTKIFLDGYANANYWTQAWTAYESDPSTSSTVLTRLNTLLSKMMQSPEFQLF